MWSMTSPLALFLKKWNAAFHSRPHESRGFSVQLGTWKEKKKGKGEKTHAPSCIKLLFHAVKELFRNINFSDIIDMKGVRGRGGVGGVSFGRAPSRD